MKSVGEKLLQWYQNHGRDLPFRQIKDPYKIWICEIIFQQTRIQQGIGHYENFIKRFPNVQELYNAKTDEVLLYWKGLGYYSRALNLHRASVQIMEDFGGKFPQNYKAILQLKGVGKYTAAAISSICFGEQLPAVDGNFYRVLSRFFADDYDVSKSSAFDYFSKLSMQLMPENKAGDFNQAMMDLGSEVCKPKNPDCGNCPFNKACIAYLEDKVQTFPVKTKKVKVEDLSLQYYFVHFGNQFLIKQRNDDFIWKKLFEFPINISENLWQYKKSREIIKTKLTHKNVTITIDEIGLNSKEEFQDFAKKNNFEITDPFLFHQKSFPKPLEEYITRMFGTINSVGS